jgi:hypothetical protein
VRRGCRWQRAAWVAGEALIDEQEITLKRWARLNDVPAGWRDDLDTGDGVSCCKRRHFFSAPMSAARLPAARI